jgi:hypothetical protein
MDPDVLADRVPLTVLADRVSRFESTTLTLSALPKPTALKSFVGLVSVTSFVLPTLMAAPPPITAFVAGTWVTEPPAFRTSAPLMKRLPRESPSSSVTLSAETMLVDTLPKSFDALVRVTSSNGFVAKWALPVTVAEPD